MIIYSKADRSEVKKSVEERNEWVQVTLQKHRMDPFTDAGRKTDVLMGLIKEYKSLIRVGARVQ